MKSFYWISFTKWYVYRFANIKNGYLLAKRFYYKSRWTPFIKVTFHKHKK